MTTDELIEVLKQHPGKKVVSWDGDISYLVVEKIEIIKANVAEDGSCETYPEFMDSARVEEVVAL